MADGDFHDPWGHGHHFSKRDLLEVIVKCGAVCTGIVEFKGRKDEQPYYGARFHAEELESEGLVTRLSETDVPDLVDVTDLIIWLPTYLAHKQFQN